MNKNMKIYFQWENEVFGTYDVALHCSISECEEILKYYKVPVTLVAYIPDYMTIDKSEYIYIFLLDTKNLILSPLHCFSYAYGNLYNGDYPVKERIENFEFDISKYAYKENTLIDDSKKFDVNKICNKDYSCGFSKVFDYRK